MAVRRVVSLVSALALFVVGAVAADRIADRDAGPAGAAPQVLVETGFVPVGGFGPRSHPAVAWTSSKLFVFGGVDGWVEPTLLVHSLKPGAARVKPAGGWFPTKTLTGVKYPMFPPKLWCMGDSAMLIGSGGVDSCDGATPCVRFRGGVMVAGAGAASAASAASG